MSVADSRAMLRPVCKLALLGLFLFATAAAKAADAPIPVKVVIISMFEAGKDTGDTPGEFQYWVEREHLNTRYPLPAAYHDVLANGDGVIGTVTGEGTAHSASSIMALGLDPRFDLTHAYWLIAGIAGIDPADGSLGSGVWANWIVDGDLAHEIDAREMPKDWKTGYFPLDSSAPYPAHHEQDGTMCQVAYHLNEGLVQWAYNLTKDVPLTDNAQMKTSRARYVGEPNAQKPPFVLIGDNLASSTFWHGRLLNQWANDWVKYWTNGQGNYVTTAMEDSGSLQSLTNLAKAGKVDLSRVMLLRTASNFDSPPPGRTAAENLAEENSGLYSAYIPSLETAYRVGSKVVHELTGHWDKYGPATPSAKP
jgi:purine nucleoside permease